MNNSRKDSYQIKDSYEKITKILIGELNSNTKNFESYSNTEGSTNGNNKFSY